MYIVQKLHNNSSMGPKRKKVKGHPTKTPKTNNRNHDTLELDDNVEPLNLADPSVKKPDLPNVGPSTATKDTAALKSADDDTSTNDHNTTSSDASTSLQFEAKPFDPIEFLKQAHTKQPHTVLKQKQRPPMLRLNTSSVAHAAAISLPLRTPPVPPKAVLNIPDNVITTPQLTTSSNISTLSKQQETPKRDFPLTTAAPVLHTAGAMTTQQNNNFHLRVTALTNTTLVSMIKTCIKTHIFRICKFYFRDKHGMYNRSAKTMCGQIMQHCNLEADAEWWYKMRTTVVKTHTDHRNNCIKRLNARFKGKRHMDGNMILYHVPAFSRFTMCIGVGRLQGGEIPMYELMNGSPQELQRMLEMRDNCLFYSEFIDYYAPAVVGSQVWNDDANMKAHCSTNDIRTFGKKVLTVSDEAFILLVMVNAAPRWMAEIVRDDCKVRQYNKY
jgi:hypothetical protein